MGGPAAGARGRLQRPQREPLRLAGGEGHRAGRALPAAAALRAHLQRARCESSFHSMLTFYLQDMISILILAQANSTESSRPVTVYLTRASSNHVSAQASTRNRGRRARLRPSRQRTAAERRGGRASRWQPLSSPSGVSAPRPSSVAFAQAKGLAKNPQLSRGCRLGCMLLVTLMAGCRISGLCLQPRDSPGLCRRAHSLRLQPTTSVADLCAAIGAADVSLVAAAGAPEVLAEGGCLEKLRSLRYVPCNVALKASA